MYNPLKKKKKQAVPRTQEALIAEFNKLATRLGQVNYQISRFEKEIVQLKAHIDNINDEMGVRLELDQAAAATKAKTEGLKETTTQGAQ